MGGETGDRMHDLPTSTQIEINDLERVNQSNFTRYLNRRLNYVLAVSVVIIGPLIYGLNKHVRRQIEMHYQHLPQSEIIRPYDTDNNGSLESDEMENLLKDYKLSKRER